MSLFYQYSHSAQESGEESATGQAMQLRKSKSKKKRKIEHNVNLPLPYKLLIVTEEKSLCIVLEQRNSTAGTKNAISLGKHYPVHLQGQKAYLCTKGEKGKLPVCTNSVSVHINYF